MRLISASLSLCFLGAFLFGASSAPAQTVNATVSGLVLDPQGAAVPDATITITSVDRNIIVRTLQTNAEGHYAAPSLQVGTYSVSAEKQGFKKSVRTGIVLNANDNIAVDFSLEVGVATETVSVIASALQVETQTATASGLINPIEMKQIPLGTRNYEQLVALMPGVSSNASDQIYLGVSNPLGGTNVVSFAIGGQRNSANNWTVDGADNVDRGSNLTLLTYPSVDAISEFKVLRGQYDAEYGRAAAGQINVVTKSGTNSFHGGAYEFFRNDVLAANNFLNNANKTKRPPLRYNDFGYTFGGPFFIPGHYNTEKSKTFFFFSQEFRRVITYGTVTGTIPTQAMLQGNFAHPVCLTRDASGTCTSTGTQITTIDPVAQEYINDIFSKLPPPNSGTFNLVNALRSTYNARQELFRVDQIFGPKFNLSVRYIHDAIPTIEPGGLFTGSPLPGVSTTSTNSPGYNWLAHVTSTFSSSLLNDGGFIFSYGAITSDITGLMNPANSPDIHVTLPFTSTLARVPTLTFSGGSSITGFGQYRDFNRNYNAFDNLTRVIGRHTFKFGVVYNYYQKTENASGANAGSFSFSSTAPSGTSGFEQAWADFLLGRSASFTQAKADLTPDMRQQQLDIYGQDQFRMRKNLTLSLGVRYSRYAQPIDKNHYLSNFDPAAYDPLKAPTMNFDGTICTAAPCSNGAIPNPNYDPLNGIIIAGQNSPFGSKIAQDQNKNFAPRIGVAWDPFSDGKTSIRAGYGMFYDSGLVGIYEQNIFANPPFAPNIVIDNAPLDNPASGVPRNAAAVLALRGTPLPMKTPYSQQWSLDVQRQISPTLLLDVGYFGSNAAHLLGIVDINEVQPGAGYAAGLTANPSTTGFTSSTEGRLNVLRPYVGYNAISVVESGFNSNYHSLQVAVQKRFQHDSLFNVYYTWSHNMTNNQSDRSTAPQNTYDIPAEYGPTQFDKRHILTMDLVYNLPWMTAQQGFVGHILGGWGISGLINYSSGSPLTATTSGVDPAGLGFLGPSAAGGRPDASGNPNTLATHSLTKFFDTSVFSTVPNGTIRAGNSGRGQIIGPGIERWDVAFLKSFKLPWESTGLQFRGEMFNVFNHTNFNGLGTLFGSSTFGKVTTVHDPRLVQLGLKFNF
jgi:Carboxypeptidase regulatory-like domain/TonB dependent receptor-like, beta-barrel/TonB-dependent Receptor Plug Domain